MTTPISATSSTTAPAAPTRKAGESGLGQDAFMKLLVAQLKYQNPMAPADGQAYMTQMATFTQVEKLGQLVTAQADAAVWQQRLSAEGLVGKTVTGTVDGVERTGAVVGVRFGGEEGPVLELADGTTLVVDAVTATRATAVTPAATSTPSTGPSTSTTPATAPAGTTAS